MIVRDSLVFRTLLAIARQQNGYDESRSHALLELLATAEALRNRLKRHLHELGLSEAQFATLVVLRALDPEPVLPTTLAAHVSASRATMTSVLDQLLARGFIVRARSSEDRRNYLITLTERGRGLSDQAEMVVLRGCTELARPLDEPAPRTLLGLCEKLVPPSRVASARTAPVCPATLSPT